MSASSCVDLRSSLILEPPDEISKQRLFAVTKSFFPVSFSLDLSFRHSSLKTGLAAFCYLRH